MLIIEKMLIINGNLAEAQEKRRIITIGPQSKPVDAALRVAAYARVSTSSDEQLNSYAAQTRYYMDYINSHKGWKLVDIYADEGITGTSSEKRDDFQRMLSDCHRGLIDRVITKSISRFSRNTKECLETIRELKSIGVTVFFEEQNLDTEKMSSEMIAAVMASLAQKESESISGNIRWSYQKRMERGEFNTCKAPYGFRLAGNKLIVETSEAKIVRQIYSKYLSGYSREEIASELRESGVPTRADVKEWKRTTISHILANERYTGNALLSKRITTNIFPHKKVSNHGERPMYYVENSNPPIISQDTFQKARQLANRQRSYSNNILKYHPLHKKIYCSYCGSVYKRQQPRDEEYWICYTRYSDKKLCQMASVTTGAIEEAFCRMTYKLKHYGVKILSDMLSQHLEVKSRRMLWSLDVIELNKRIGELTCQNQLLSMLKQQGLVDPDIFISQSNVIAEQLCRAKQEKSRLLEAESDYTVQHTQELMDMIVEIPDFLENFDPDLFCSLVEKVLVQSEDTISFQLINGLQLTERIEKRQR